MKTKLTLLSLLLLTALTAMDQPRAKVFIEPIRATVVTTCFCDEWDCTYQGGPNSGCRRFCMGDYGTWWFEYKECGYCPDPDSLCPPSE